MSYAGPLSISNLPLLIYSPIRLVDDGLRHSWHHFHEASNDAKNGLGYTINLLFPRIIVIRRNGEKKYIFFQLCTLWNQNLELGRRA